MLFSFYSLRGDTNLGLFLASNLSKLASLIFLIGAPPTLDTCMSLVWGSSGKVMQMRQHDLRLKDACKSANTGTVPRNVAVRGSPRHVAVRDSLVLRGGPPQCFAMTWEWHCKGLCMFTCLEHENPVSCAKGEWKLSGMH